MCDTLTWHQITLFITSLVTLGWAAVNCYDRTRREQSLFTTPWVCLIQCFGRSELSIPGHVYILCQSFVCSLMSVTLLYSSHNREEWWDPTLNICQNFLHRHFCGDGSSLWHSLHNIAPSVTSFYPSATSAIPGVSTLLVLHVPRSMTRVSHLITHVAAV